MSNCETIVVTEDVLSTIEVIGVGPKGDKGDQGIPGPQGPGNAITYTHIQSTASSTWTVAHNFGRKPSITVVDNSDNRIFADERFIDNNISQISFAVPTTGRVYCS